MGVIVLGAAAVRQPAGEAVPTHPIQFAASAAPASRAPTKAPAATSPIVVVIPTSTPELTAEPTPEPDPTATPRPTPINFVDDSTWDVSSKSSKSGKAGTYTWSDVYFTDELSKVALKATAPTGKGCSVKWSTTDDYGDPLSRTVTVSAGTTRSGSLEYESGYDSAAFVVFSTCPTWTLTLSSYEMPAYWNPWGYSFKAGSYIYDPPIDFCYYFDCIPSFWDSTNGYVMQCADKMFSHSGGRSGSCSYHGGNYRPLYRH